MHALDEIVADPARPAPSHLILDVTRSESFQRRATADLRAITEHFLRHASVFERRCAVVVEGAVGYGLARMTSTWLEMEDVQVRIFSDTEEASRWLLRGVP